MERLSDPRRRLHFGPPGSTRNVRVVTPWGIPVVCHFEVAPRFLYACALACLYGGGWRPLRIDSLAVRPIRGGSEWSLHAYGLAWDFFSTPPAVPPPGGVRQPRDGMPEAFGRQFERYGFTWGKRWSNPDIPHVEWAAARPRALQDGGVI